MALAPLGQYLNVSPWEVEGGVHIPDFCRRLHELPSPSVPLRVCGEEDDVRVAIEWLRAGGRVVEPADVAASGPAPHRPRWRLWSPHPWVFEVSSGSGQALDVGCGSGRDAVCLAAQGWKVTAVDNLPDALDRVSDLQARYAPGSDLQTFEFVPDAAEFDLVTMIRFFDPGIFAQIDQFVRPGGRVIIETYSEEHRARTGRPRNPALVLSRVPTGQGFEIERWETGPVWTRLMMRRLDR